MTATACPSCGTGLRQAAHFCDTCGAPIASVRNSTEYKQVTVLFADVVESMDIAAALGAERYREIIADLFKRSAAVVQRYGGTVDKFTGDGIMALFGAPVAVENHALRACLAALDIQSETRCLTATVDGRDAVSLRLRVGLNSGLVIVGEIGSTPMSYTAVGEQVGMAQRMESVAPPGGVMLAESTARLVAATAILGELEMVQIKGARAPVPVRSLIAVASDRAPAVRFEAPLIGRGREMSSLNASLDHASEGTGRVVGVVGPPGIGKSRVVRECIKLAKQSRIEVFSIFCESHAKEIPFGAAARLLQDFFGIIGLENDAARTQVRTKLPGWDATELILLDDLLGIRDSAVEHPEIDPDARRRRLASLLNTASLAGATPALYIIEDAHWIDNVSDSLFADLFSVIPQINALVLVTYRPEYRGELSRVLGDEVLSLAPLDYSETATLVAELLGRHSTVTKLAAQVTTRAAGNPFFAEEMVRDLAERSIIEGSYGNYTCLDDVTDISVPATLMTTIAARIDRLGAAAKRTLNAAAIIGSRFTMDLLDQLLDTTVIDELLEAELIDRAMSAPCTEYTFCHPLIQTVAYQSQLVSERRELHRRLAAAIEQSAPNDRDANAALIAGHLEAANDLAQAFDWHMRAATWSTSRDVTAARMHWQRARGVADRLPADGSSRTTMQIAPRTLLCGTAWRVGGSIADTGFEELHELAKRNDNQGAIAIGMAGLLMTLTFHNRYREASRLASEYAGLLESIGDPDMTIGLLYAALWAKLETGEMTEVRRLAQRVIDLAAGDPTRGNLIIGSPLAVATTMRACANMLLGTPGWKDDFDAAIAMAYSSDATSCILTIVLKYLSIENGTLVADTLAMRDTAQALEIAEQSGDDFILALAQIARGVTLVYRDGPERETGFGLLTEVRARAQLKRFTMTALPAIDIQIARKRARTGDFDGAIEMARAVLNDLFSSGEMIYRGAATALLVESLLRRAAEVDLDEAQAAIDRLTAVPTDPGFVLHEIPLLRLRALLARAKGNEAAYGDFVNRYRARATDCGFDGHIAVADNMSRDMLTST